MIAIITFIIIGLLGVVGFDWIIILKRHSYIIHYRGYIIAPLYNFMFGENIDILWIEKVKNDINYRLNSEYSLDKNDL